MSRAPAKSIAAPQPRRSTNQAQKAEKKPYSATPPAGARSNAMVPASSAAKQASKQEKRHRVAVRMTEAQSALLDQLKSRSISLGHAAKKGDVIFAGLRLLSKLSDKGFEAAMLPLVSMPAVEENATRKKMASRREK